jgi:hypothetical protein
MVSESAEIQALRMIVRFYKSADVVLAPNLELLRMLESETKRPAFLMQRGVETDQFSPRKRTRQENRAFRIGFVGRLSPEKTFGFWRDLNAASPKGVSAISALSLSEMEPTGDGWNAT